MNEIAIQTKFLKSRLNWDADIPLLGQGESKYYLNTIPEDSEHIGARTNCLGNTQVTVYIPNYSYTESTVTTTNPNAITQRYEFTLSSVPQILELRIKLNDQLKHLYISGTGYATVALFYAHVVSEVRKLYERDLSSYWSTGAACYFVFKILPDYTSSLLVGVRSTGTYPTTLTVIGSYYDILNDNTYYWVYDTDNAPGATPIFLLQYVNYNNVVIRVNAGGLQLSKGMLVMNPFIVGRNESQLLYWTYSNGVSYRINIYDCLTLGHSYIYGPYTYMSSESAFTLIRPLPGFTSSLSCVDSYANDITLNNGTKYYLVMPRYKFIDGESSVFIGVSRLIYPQFYAENSLGVSMKLANKKYSLLCQKLLASPVYGNTYINDIISKLEYAVKYGNGNWALADLEVASTSGQNETVYLTGSEYSTDLAVSDVERLFDYVPQKTGSQHFINNNRLALVDCTEGYDNVDIEGTVTNNNWPPDLTVTRPAFNISYTGSEDTPGTWTYTVTPTTISTTISATHGIYIKKVDREYYAYVQDDYGKTQAQLCTALASAINYTLEHDNGGVDYSSASAARSGNNVSVYTNAASFVVKYFCLRSYKKGRTLKMGARHYWGIVYADNFGRCGGVNKIENTPAAISRFTNIAGTEYYVTNTCEIEITNDNPDWAQTARLFYGGSDMSSFQQLVLKRDDISFEQDRIRIFINNPISAGVVLNPAFNIGSYVYNKGDKFVFLAYKENLTETYDSKVITFTNFITFSAFVNLDILEQDESGIYINMLSNDTLISGIDSCTYCLIEVYTPRNDKPIEYLETPYNDGVSNLTPTFDDVCLDHQIHQVFYMDEGLPISCWIESSSFSNYFESKTQGLGRVNFYSPDFKRLRRNIIRASNIYIPNSSVNGLSTFEYKNEAIINEAFGSATDSKVIGNVLKIIQPHKIGSMYLGAQLGTDVSGNQILLSSDSILTDINYNALQYGSIHPESIIEHNQFLYGFDAINSVVWRDSPGGTFAISDNAMRSYFKYKVRQLIDSCGYNFRALGTYDYLNEMYLITFKDPYNSANDETLGFHEPSEAWYSFYSFLPEMYCGIPGDYMLSFSAGKLYIHNNATRNNFYGTQYTSKAWVVGNQYPDDAKKWNSIFINSNDVWAPSDNDGVIVDSDAIAYQDNQNYTTHRGGMQSSIKEANFRYFNGEFRSEFFRDATTSSSTFSVTDLFNGRPLMGKTILVKLVNDNTSAVYLRGVRINAQTVR